MAASGAPIHQFEVEGLSNRITTPGYTYDGDGRRTRKTYGWLATHYFYDALGNPVWEYKPGTAAPWERVRLYFDGKLLAVKTASEDILWTHADNLGTPRVKTDSTGQVPVKQNIPYRDWYYPYGERINVPVDPLTRRFTGQDRDAESGLDYFGARFYSPSLGRFMTVDPSRMSADPANPQSWNRYSYVLNNPLRLVDRDGKEPIDLGSLVATAEETVTAIKEYFNTVVGEYFTESHSTQEQRKDSDYSMAPIVVDSARFAKDHFENFAGGMAVVDEMIIISDPSGLAQIGDSAVRGDAEGTMVNVALAALPGDEIIFRGRKITNRLAKALGIDRKRLGKAVESIKHAVGLKPKQNVAFTRSGNLIIEETGEIVGNVFEELTK